MARNIVPTGGERQINAIVPPANLDVVINAQHSSVVTMTPTAVPPVA